MEPKVILILASAVAFLAYHFYDVYRKQKKKPSAQIQKHYDNWVNQARTHHMNTILEEQFKNDYPEKHKQLAEKRIKVDNNNIYINNLDEALRNTSFEITPVIKFNESSPEITIFEDNKLVRKFIIEPLTSKPPLKGRYFHSSIRVNSNSSVQIDGIISDSESTYDVMGEGIRFQPFFLSDNEEDNQKLKGLGMFDRGLHYQGLVTPSNVRLVCTCNECSKSFGVEFIHAGFAEVQYFYSSNSKETLIVPYDNKLSPVPHQTQKDFDENLLIEIESKLPTTIDGKFEYYNSFKCPHCFADFINFRNNKELRQKEYYANYYINNNLRRLG